MVDHVHCNQKWNLVSHVLVPHTKVKPCWLGFLLGLVTVNFFFLDFIFDFIPIL